VPVLAAPSKTPKSIIGRLNAEIVQIYADPKFRQQIINQGNEPVAGTPEEFAAFIKRDRELSAQLLKVTNVPPPCQ
jgi:tripartite-type tricarboxylate transporter receptor subunit TctC